MNGFELCERIRGSATHKHLPVVALTSLASDEHVRRGNQVGVSEYLIKLDRDKLVLALTAVAGLVGAAAWAQWIEGSSRLLRPYGWYGGVLGVAAGCLAAPLFGTPVLLVAAAYCVAAPWMQAIERAAYLASAELAAEKGAFPLYEQTAILAAPNVARLADDVRAAISAHGLRMQQYSIATYSHSR